MIGLYVPSNTILHNLDSRAKLISLITLFIAIVQANSILGYLLFASVVIFIAAISKTMYIIPDTAKTLWLFLFFIFLINSLFYNGPTNFPILGSINVSLEGIYQGGTIALNIFAIVILCSILTTTTPPLDITSALGALLKPLIIIGVPTYDVAMIISIAMRFVPTLIEETEMLKKSQYARGAAFNSKNLIKKAVSFFPLLIPIFIAAFRRADELATAMEARGYKNAKDRTKKEIKPLCKKDYFCCVFCGIILFIIYII